MLKRHNTESGDKLKQNVFINLAILIIILVISLLNKIRIWLTIIPRNWTLDDYDHNLQSPKILSETTMN